MLALINSTLINGTGAAPRHGEIVVLDGKRIAAVGRSVIIPENSQVVDLKGKILMPGLIHSHIHAGDHPFKNGAGRSCLAHIDSAD